MIKEKYIITVAVLLVLLLAVIAGTGVFSIDTEKTAGSVSASLTLKDDGLKKTGYTEAKSQIFSPLNPPPAPKPVIVEVKKELPPPVDPYEQYNKDLKTYQIFGFSKDGANTIVFLSRGDMTFTLKKGDVLDTKYIIKELTDTEVTVGLVNDDNYQYKLTQR